MLIDHNLTEVEYKDIKLSIKIFFLKNALALIARVNQRKAYTTHGYFLIIQNSITLIQRRQLRK